MSLENLKTNLIVLNKNDFGNDFFLGMSSSRENSIKNKEDNLFFLNKNHHYHLNDESFYEIEFDKYKQDIALSKQSGILNFRFSLSWTRIMPDGIGNINHEAISFYHSILDICKENGVEPFVTLYDSCLPTELIKIGGWSNRESLKWFENYVALCANTFKEKVTYWTIFNEPSVFTGASNFFEIYPSGKNKINLFLSALHHTLLCQSIGFKKIKEIVPNAQLGTFLSCNYTIPMTYSEKDLKATERIDAFLNRIFIEPSLGMEYPMKSLPFLKSISKYTIAGDDDLIKVDFDFIGLQNCTSEIVCHNAFVPYLNAKIIEYDKLRVKKNYLDHKNYQALLYEIIKKYSKYEGVKKIFLNETVQSIYDQHDLNSAVAIKNIYPIQTFLQQIVISNQNESAVEGYFISAV